MSVLIKGMKMPKDKPIRIVLNPNGQLFVDHGVHFTEYEAVELPLHGRLIDAENMLFNESEAFVSAQVQLEKNGDMVNQLINEVVHKKIQMLIADTPTIIGAEEGE